VVLVSLRLRRLVRIWLRGHLLAAVHLAIAVLIGAAAILHGMALMLVMWLTRRHLVPRVVCLRGSGAAALLVLRMVLVLRLQRRSLGDGRHGERKRERTDKNLHFNFS